MGLKVAEVVVGAAVFEVTGHPAGLTLFCLGDGRCPAAHPQSNAVTSHHVSFPLRPTNGSHTGSARHSTLALAPRPEDSCCPECLAPELPLGVPFGRRWPE